MTNKKSPSDKTVNGIVNMMSKGFTVTFKRESITAIIIATMKLSTYTPGRMYDAIITANDDKSIFTRKFII
jgi:hypothetical protein